MSDHPDHTTCHFTGEFFTGLALVENPIRHVEQIAGWEYTREMDNFVLVKDHDPLPCYVATGNRAEWVKPREFRSRSEKRMGKNLPKLAYGDGHRDGDAE